MTDLNRHSPAPWHIVEGEDATFLVAANTVVLATIGELATTADQNMFVAAPNLLAGLQTLLALLESDAYPALPEPKILADLRELVEAILSDQELGAATFEDVP